MPTGKEKGMNYKTTPAGRATAQKYSDILDKQRPTPSYKHPKMSLSNRAKIFSPFAALRGYDEEIKSEALQLQLITKPELSDEDKEKLSDKLLQIRKGMTITVSYFRSSTRSTTPTSTTPTSPDLSNFSTPVEIGAGHITTITATVDAVDPITHTLRLYTGVVNEFGKELPVVISFEEILEVCTLQISTTQPIQRS